MFNFFKKKPTIKPDIINCITLYECVGRPDKLPIDKFLNGAKYALVYGKKGTTIFDGNDFIVTPSRYQRYEFVSIGHFNPYQDYNVVVYCDGICVGTVPVMINMDEKAKAVFEYAKKSPDVDTVFFVVECPCEIKLGDK